MFNIESKMVSIQSNLIVECIFVRALPNTSQIYMSWLIKEWPHKAHTSSFQIWPTAALVHSQEQSLQGGNRTTSSLRNLFSTFLSLQVWTRLWNASTILQELQETSQAELTKRIPPTLHLAMHQIWSEMTTIPPNAKWRVKTIQEAWFIKKQSRMLSSFKYELVWGQASFNF